MDLRSSIDQELGVATTDSFVVFRRLRSANFAFWVVASRLGEAFPVMPSTVVSDRGGLGNTQG